MAAFSSLMVTLAITGGILAFSSVPFVDMWDGALGFYLRAESGGWETWWAQHNEHRIPIARALFWIDLSLFGGNSIFLIVINYLLAGTSSFIFWLAIRAINRTANVHYGEIFVGLFITSWLFLWTQSENFTWPFQSLFFLAQLMPLLGLYWLHISTRWPNRNLFFAISCVIGIGSVGSMANGIITLPLMTIYAILLRQSLRRIGLLGLLSIITCVTYFYNYQSVSGHASLLESLSSHPIDVAKYVLFYIGSPFYYLLGQGLPGTVTAAATGLILIFLSCTKLITFFRRPDQSIELALLLFILYLGGTALGTAGGRLSFGLDQAFSLRYTTPALMAWAALLVLFLPNLLQVTSSPLRKNLVIIFFSVLGTLMLKLQFTALIPQDQFLFRKNAAALALELGVKDHDMVRNITINTQNAIDVSEKASAQNLAIFGLHPFVDLRKQLGELALDAACLGSLDRKEAIVGDARFVRVYGWFFDKALGKTPKIIRFLNEEGRIVGIALTGQQRLDVANAIDPKAIRAGYLGYIYANQTERLVTMRDETGCAIKIAAPP
jgi:hypothetical protein